MFQKGNNKSNPSWYDLFNAGSILFVPYCKFYMLARTVPGKMLVTS